MLFLFLVKISTLLVLDNIRNMLQQCICCFVYENSSLHHFSFLYHLIIIHSRLTCRMQIQPIPNSEQELLQRAKSIAGYSLSEIAKSIDLQVPLNLKKEKGWVGKLIEIYLGANAGSKAERDFTHLGIELKTIPINTIGLPLETTFVCVAPLVANHGITWQTSHVKYKLNKVLWVPVEGNRDIPLASRRIGLPILWQPSIQEEKQLQHDWQELMDMIVLGQIEKITARQGEYLQIRPKAANGKALTEAFNENGEPIMTRPRGFYLKKIFTTQIIKNHLNQLITL